MEQIISLQAIAVSSPKMEENLKMGQGIISRDEISIFFFVCGCVCVCASFFLSSTALLRFAILPRKANKEQQERYVEENRKE